MIHTWQAHGPIRICEACGLVRHEDCMHDLPPCDSAEMDAMKARIEAKFMQKLAEKYPDHPWIKDR